MAPQTTASTKVGLPRRHAGGADRTHTGTDFRSAASPLGYAGSRHAASYACLKRASVASEVERVTGTCTSRRSTFSATTRSRQRQNARDKIAIYPSALLASRFMTEQPPTCTAAQLLAVPCPTCRTAVGVYCESAPGKVLLLPNHHADRFWAESAALNAIDN